MALCLSFRLIEVGIETAKHSIMQTTSHDNEGNLDFWCHKCWWNSNGIIPNECVWVAENRLFSTNKLVYLRNDARQGHSYYGKLGTHMRCIEWYYFHDFAGPW